MRLNKFNHSHKKRNDSFETPAVLLIFSLELQIFEVAIQRRHQTAKNGCFHLFSEEVLSENDIQAVLVTFCCYDYGPNAFETVANMHTDIGYY